MKPFMIFHAVRSVERGMDQGDKTDDGKGDKGVKSDEHVFGGVEDA